MLYACDMSFFVRYIPYKTVASRAVDISRPPKTLEHVAINFKILLAKSAAPAYFKDDRNVGHYLIEHIQFQFSACKRRKIRI